MKIITSKNSFDWIKIAVEGIHAVVTTNKYGTQFLNLYGNTFPIKDKLSQLGFSFFKPKGTWNIPVKNIDDRIKGELTNLGIDISVLDIKIDVPPVPQETQPVSNIAPEKPQTMVEQTLEEMKDGIEMAKKQEGASGKVRGLLSFIDRMIERVAQLTDETAQNEFIKSFLDFASRFHDYSFGNQMLIWVQKPNATYVRGAKQWMEMGREVSDWKNGITIIAPMYKKMPPPENELVGKTKEEIDALPQLKKVFFSAVTIFDISDTQPIPEWEKMTGKKSFQPPPLKTVADQDIDELNILIEATNSWARKNNIDINTEKMAQDLGGYSAGGKIRINDLYKGINLFSTLIHECAHEVLHWEVKEGKKVRPAGKPESRQSKEIDAETTSYIVLKHYGFDSPDAPSYLALWKAKGEDIKKRREQISKAVEAIVDGIDSEVKSIINVEAKKKIKIKLSKSQWDEIGKMKKQALIGPGFHEFLGSEGWKEQFGKPITTNILIENSPLIMTIQMSNDGMHVGVQHNGQTIGYYDSKLKKFNVTYTKDLEKYSKYSDVIEKKAQEILIDSYGKEE